MAASDATYRNIRRLHVVFAASSIVMLLTIIGMFAKDYFRDWKVEQRLFFDVEEEMAKRALLEAAPTDEDVRKLGEMERELRDRKAALAKARADMEKGLGDLPARKLKTEREQADVKASVDSIQSFINRTAEVREEGLLSAEAQRQKAELDRLTARLNELTAEVQKNQAEYDAAAKNAGLPMMEEDIARLEKQQKEKLGDFDRFIKLASQKRWSAAESIRTLPILDAFSSPTRIQQYTLNDLPIDYSFKYVTRYDRCTTCHLGMEKAAYDVATLTELTSDPAHSERLQGRLKGAQAILQARRDAGVTDLPSDRAIEPRRLDPERLTPGRVKQFAAHPRLDLFVDANSPHPAEKFGCTICHSGQGSATAFYEASHSPNSAPQTKDWVDKQHWKSNHYWDFPMLPARFVESSCVKCHHEVTDLIRNGNQVEAPKLVKGYNLVKELGCFGCHEISGMKSGHRVGPDLRLEPDPPLEELSPADRARALADPLNPPGELRKVGPNLARLAEKTNEDWVRLWLKSPRGFRETTKMPHFYLQPNNRPDALPEEQQKFPDNEIHAVAHYLLTKSKAHVDELRRYAAEKPEARQADAEQDRKLEQRIRELEAQRGPKVKEPQKLDEQIARAKKDREILQGRIRERNRALAVAAPTALQKLPANPDPARGQMLFQERGCLACHSHQGTEQPGPEVGGKRIPPIVGDATFAPDLSRLAHKIRPQGGAAEDGRKWVVSWLLNPAAHNPRTYMPDTQLTDVEANDIAAWLLGQNVGWKVGEEQRVAPADVATLADMAELYLRKVLTIGEVRDALKRDERTRRPTGGFTAKRLRELAKGNAEADELELGGDLAGKKDDEVIPLDEHRLKMYVGKKAIGNLGCYACHSVPGFEKAKPIGTALNEWGKKDTERLAFEDAHKFVEHHFNVVPSRDDPKDPKKPAADFVVKDGKKPYEQFFFDKLEHHGRSREGFLHLKLAEPRSYDYNRIRAWDDRLRMPQFKFARPRRLPDETREQYEARTVREEAEAREAVMTFILGLVAESIPARYVNAPSGDRLHEVKGRQVLDKFNCAGCHLIRPGSTEFKPLPVFNKLENGTPEQPNPHPDLYKHEEPYKGLDYFQPNHIAWSGRDQTAAARPRLQGTPPPIAVKEEEDEDQARSVRVWLMQALRFRKDGKKDGDLRDLPAAAQVTLTPDMVVGQTPSYGGAFMDKLAPYLQKKDPETYAGTDAKVSLAYASVPPTLIGEGEKVQPEWLFRFLRNPYKIRPLTVLRMPKFNLSADDAQAIVNYFAAVDRKENVGIGLTYPYEAMPQREEAYLLQKTAEYVARLKAGGQYDARRKELQKFWEEALAAQKDEADRAAREAAERHRAAPEAGKEEAKKALDEAQKRADAAAQRVRRKDVAELARRWEEREAYLADASRLVVHANLCLTCHSAGGHPGKEDKGPLLDNAGERLRPDWTMRWITNPKRFLHYDSVMPINFPSTKTDYQDAFVGSSADQIQAVRDYLMIYPQVRDWPVLRARPVLGVGTAPMPAGGENK